MLEITGDNNDINEETIDEKRTTHATTLVVYQRDGFGPCTSASYKCRPFHKNTINSSHRVPNYRGLQCIYVKRLVIKDLIGEVKDEWFSITREFHECMTV